MLGISYTIPQHGLIYTEIGLINLFLLHHALVMICIMLQHIHYKLVLLWFEVINLCLQIVKYNPDPCLMLSQLLREECIFFIMYN